MLKTQSARRIGFVGIRSLSTGKSTLTEYLQDPNKLIVIPITSRESFVYFKHSPTLLNKQSALIRGENYVSDKCAKLWKRMLTSPKKINKKIVSMVQVFLDNIHWQETSLKTIPGENHLLKRIRGQNEQKVTAKQYLNLTTNNENTLEKIRMEPISVYYPGGSIIGRDKVEMQMTRLYENGIQNHKKYMWYCLLGVPLTLPLVLIPIIPNVPGFYLTYRAYCNWKAYMGAKHLKSMLRNKDTVLQFKQLEGYDSVVARGASMDNIVSFLKIDEMSSHLNEAQRQETKKL